MTEQRILINLEAGGTFEATVEGGRGYLDATIRQYGDAHMVLLTPRDLQAILRAFHQATRPAEVAS